VSDSSNQLHQLEELVKGSQLRLGQMLECDLGEGWFELFKETIEEIKEHSVEITSIDTSYGELDVHISPYEDTNTSVAFLVVQSKRLFSRGICSNCGATIHKFPPTPTIDVLCRLCEKERAKSGRTGTWLDNY